jgi:hypothetical protein
MEIYNNRYTIRCAIYFFTKFISKYFVYRQFLVKKNRLKVMPKNNLDSERASDINIQMSDIQ